MAKYPIKMLLDELKRPFFPLVTIDTIVTNNSDKTLKELFDDRYTKAEVDKIISDLGTLQRLRGTVNSYEELLAIENPLPGDTYILLVESGINAEYMYIGDRWEMLGTTATYTDVYSKEVIDEMLLALKQEINTKAELDDAEVLSQAKIYAENLFANVPKPNLDEYYKKTEADAKIDEKISAYKIPVASTNTVGGIKVGANLSVDENGVLNADKTTVIDELTNTSKTDALSANMGRELNNRVLNLEQNSGGIDRDQLLDLVYPIGSLYMSMNATDPKDLFGGTWERIKDRFIYANGDSTASGATGGSTVHNHGLGSGFTAMNIGDGGIQYQEKQVGAWGTNAAMNIGTSYNSNQTKSWGIALGGATDNGNNIPPYITAYIWKRTA